MPYGLPVRGQFDWDDEINNSIDAVKSTADTASAVATAAQNAANSASATATSANNTANDAATAATNAASAASAAQITADTANSSATTALANAATAQATADAAPSQENLAARLEVAGSASRLALDAVYNNAGLPATAGARTNPFFAERNFYNLKATNTRKIRAALGRAKAGSGVANVLFHGDSHTEGKVNATDFDRTKCFSVQFRDTLAALSIPVGGDGMVLAGNGANSTPIDPRVTTTGTWTHTGGYAQSVTNGATLTITFTNDCESIDIWSSGASGAFTVHLDEVLQTTVNPTGAAAWVKTTVSGTAGAHVVKITKTNTTLTAIRCMNGYSASGLLIHNMGIAGWSANNFITFTSWFQGGGSIEQVLPKAGVDLAVFNIGVNDIVLQGRTPAQAAADFATLVGRWQPGPDVILTIEPHSSAIPQATYDTYAGLVYDLADTLDVPLLDIYSRIGTFTEGDDNGLYGDSSHITTAGHADWGRNLALAVAS